MYFLLTLFNVNLSYNWIGWNRLEAMTLIDWLIDSSTEFPQLPVGPDWDTHPTIAAASAITRIILTDVQMSSYQMLS